MPIKAIARLLAVLNGNVRSAQLAGAVVAGFALAHIPPGNLVWFALFVAVLFIKVNYGLVLVALAAWTPLSLLLAGVRDELGWALLSQESLRPFFVSLMDAPIAPLLRFNNSLVAGGFLLSLIAAVPLFVLFLFFFKLYRRKLAPALAKSKPVRWFTRLPLVQKLSAALESARRVAGILGE